MNDINIVIVNHKMKDKIRTCLSTLFRESDKSHLDVQVVVVDNASGDGIGQMLAAEFPRAICILQDENVGFGRAQNLGIRAAEARYYFALNPDTEFHSDGQTLERLHAFMEANSKVGMIGPKLVYPDGSLQYSCWRFPPFFQPFYQRTKLGQTKRGVARVAHHHMKDFDHTKTIPVDAVMGSAMFVRRDALRDVGLFDERFWMYYEDIDWSRRMWEAGWPVYYVHDIVLTHIHGRGSAQIPGVFRALVKNRLARVHVKSWIQYLWKWRRQNKYYIGK
jgi:N-acetylglucosaminyl-diphospho-decaprenol L-rhamnosyltransferase